MISQEFSENLTDAVRFEKKEPSSEDTTYSIEIEQELLGAILQDNQYFHEVREFLEAGHFYYPLHQHIYEKIDYTILQAKNIASAKTIRYLLENDDIFKENNGAIYLNDLEFSVSTSMNAISHAKTIFDLARRRLLLQELSSYQHELRQKPTLKVDDCIIDIEKTLYDLSTSTSINEYIQSFAHVTLKAMKEAEETRKKGMMGLPTQFMDLDNKIGGLNNSDLIILAGRPGMGKTAVACNIALRVARKLKANSGSVLFFSHEMAADQVMMRILGIEASVNISNLRNGKMTDADFKKLVDAQHHLGNLPLYIDDTAGMNVIQMLQRARRHQREKGLSLVIVDYLQLMQAARRNDNRAVEISEISRGLKSIAKELNIPVIALAQLNRKAELRDDPKPNLADLRDSGSIEQDADIVLFIYREHYYLLTHTPKQKETEPEHKFQERSRKHTEKLEAVKKDAALYISKNRHGADGVVHLVFEREYGRFDNKLNQNIPTY